MPTMNAMKARRTHKYSYNAVDSIDSGALLYFLCHFSVLFCSVYLFLILMSYDSFILFALIFCCVISL